MHRVVDAGKLRRRNQSYPARSVLWLVPSHGAASAQRRGVRTKLILLELRSAR